MKWKLKRFSNISDSKLEKLRWILPFRNILISFLVLKNKKDLKHEWIYSWIFEFTYWFYFKIYNGVLKELFQFSQFKMNTSVEKILNLLLRRSHETVFFNAWTKIRNFENILKFRYFKMNAFIHYLNVGSVNDRAFKQSRVLKESWNFFKMKYSIQDFSYLEYSKINVSRVSRFQHSERKFCSKETFFLRILRNRKYFYFKFMFI